MRSHWSGRLAFILAASGSAVGLGNIWKFPYITGLNGGGAFVLAYLITIAIVGFPIFIAEVFIGQKSQANAVKSFEVIHRPKSPFRFTGIMGIVSAFLILSFYSVVGGWILSFEFRSITGSILSLSSEQMAEQFGNLVGDPLTQIFWHSIFMILTVSIVIGGISKGIEKWSKILMPAFFLILVGMTLYAMTLDGFGQAFAFLFKPDFHKLTGESILEAVGHSFFTLSLGMGAMITYGSYLAKDESVLKISLAVSALDTVVALLAGLMMFSICFTYGQEPSSGPGLMFQTMPTLFSQMAGGQILLIVFFALVTFAALTSAMSLLEVVVTYFDEHWNWPRKRATIVFGSIIWALGILCAMSFGILPFSVFDLFDHLTSRILMPLGGLLTALFLGWVVKRQDIEAICGGSTLAASGLIIISRYVAPIGVLIVLIQGIHDWLLS